MSTHDKYKPKICVDFLWNCMGHKLHSNNWVYKELELYSGERSKFHSSNFFLVYLNNISKIHPDFDFVIIRLSTFISVWLSNFAALDLVPNSVGN